MSAHQGDRWGSRDVYNPQQDLLWSSRREDGARGGEPRIRRPVCGWCPGPGTYAATVGHGLDPRRMGSRDAIASSPRGSGASRHHGHVAGLLEVDHDRVVCSADLQPELAAVAGHQGSADASRTVVDPQVGRWRRCDRRGPPCGDHSCQQQRQGDRHRVACPVEPVCCALRECDLCSSIWGRERTGTRPGLRGGSPWVVDRRDHGPRKPYGPGSSAAGPCSRSTARGVMLMSLMRRNHRIVAASRHRSARPYCEPAAKPLSNGSQVAIRCRPGPAAAPPHRRVRVPNPWACRGMSWSPAP